MILIADDDITTNNMLQTILRNAGFLTCSTFDAAGSIEAIRRERPELILLDVGLPDGNGIDVCRRIRKEPAAAQTPVLFISANDDIATKVQGFEAGGVDYITKPLSGVEVLARVGTHLRLKHAYEKIAELQAERVWKLAMTQEAVMPLPKDLPDARFQVKLTQVLNAGGDFYDVIPSGNQVFDYIVADAAGHDLSSSYWTAALKTLLSIYAEAVAPGAGCHGVHQQRPAEDTAGRYLFHRHLRAAQPAGGETVAGERRSSAGGDLPERDGYGGR